MSAVLLDRITEYIMRVTLRAGQADPGLPSEREKELYRLITNP